MKLRTTCRAGATLTIVMASVVAGCGGGGGLSKGELVKQANTICKRHNDTITAAASKVLAGGRLPSREEFGKLAVGTIVPEYSAQIKELRKLEAGGSLTKPYKGWLDDSESVRAKVQQNPSLIMSAANFSPVNQQADKLGLSRSCHVGPS
ncbi:MAG: hypothetical protein M3Z33_05840 [Actinomycetota bacterium]|nr:hypothetical protein [Actinomycetota bacterium]